LGLVEIHQGKKHNPGSHICAGYSILTAGRRKCFVTPAGAARSAIFDLDQGFGGIRFHKISLKQHFLI
jgi:hypothetical protein